MASAQGQHLVHLLTSDRRGPHICLRNTPSFHVGVSCPRWALCSLGALLVSSQLLLLLAQGLCLAMMVHLHVLCCGHKGTLDLRIFISGTFTDNEIVTLNIFFFLSRTFFPPPTSKLDCLTTILPSALVGEAELQKGGRAEWNLPTQLSSPAA